MTVVLGPCPCQGCGQPVVYGRAIPALLREIRLSLPDRSLAVLDEMSALAWREPTGRNERHACAREAVA